MAALYYLGWIVVSSLITFVFYGWDKRQAGNKGWRVPEKTLHTLSVMGGWPGAIAGQQFFRHKTQKTSFRVVFYLTILIHIGLVGWLAWTGYFSGGAEAAG
ncbi:MAG: DUF1294 domain-containing protein [Planctomycetota bacterium]